MKIAQIAPLYEAVPPKFYGGTERVVSFLTEEMVALGHDVTLFASADSKTKAKLEPMWPQALRLSQVGDQNAPHAYLFEQVYRRAHEFDILHFHLDYLPFSLFGRQDVPFITTLHGRLDLEELQPVYTIFNDVPIVSISNSQRIPLPQANFVATVLHGLPLDLLRPVEKSQDYLAFLGRIAPEKNVIEAIEIADRAGMKLKIAAKIDRADRTYYEEQVAEHFKRPHVEYIGEIADHQKAEFLSGAKALLMPIYWPEPFGLVMIEAMACGIPTVAYKAGSVPEVLEDGLTGYIATGVEAATAAVKKLDQLPPRSQIRKRFEERFSAKRMAEDYLEVYRRLIEEKRPVLQGAKQ
ncbi:Glycosyltransferase involved in cell wall bisynthesis [Arboricoccus pini]|uniref:Glycosyltransferase involved in cell wall bisynthesis n=1 Tax=Arboricoccus pini TaxID=1963835 RepID=A0A212QPQ9_9PROT|nr:glycosyltransferase family 4 protein [Arboricoccus pini]SNB61423.1 Glycosyltransferase involved in cell wall bisynthesis [Arboricoccus pini]